MNSKADLVLSKKDESWTGIQPTRSLGSLTSSEQDARQEFVTSAKLSVQTSATVRSSTSVYFSTPYACFINSICINNNNILLIKDRMIKSKYVEKKYIYKQFQPKIFYLLQHGFVITLLNCKNLVRLKNKEKEKSLLYFQKVTRVNNSSMTNE